MAPDAPPGPGVRALVALDDSPGALHAARTAAALLGPLGAELLVLNVARTPVPWIASTHAFGAVAAMELDLLSGPSEEEVRALIAERATAAGIPDPEVLLSAGDPVAEICAAADEHDVDLIVVGSHDRTVLARLFVPSVAAGVVKRTSRPVLVVNEPG